MEGKKILVVDDDLAFCEMLTEILSAEGAEVLVCHDGQSGLDTAFANHPDIVLFDVMMPGISGLAALEQLRADAWGKNIPALLLTNVSEPGAIASSIENGPPTEYLLKIDWTLDQIAEKIKTILAKTQ